MQCSISDCKNKSVAKGLCDKHRLRLRRHGDPTVTKIEYYKSLEEYFNSKMGKIESTDNCVLWKGKFLPSGYGILTAKHKRSLAHRLSYLLYKGKIKKGLQICHSCDIPACVNPRHLWTGTQKENVRDAMKKGRHSKPPISKLKKVST